MPTSPTIWTIGHSNQAIGAFVEMLAGESIELVADVRRFPGSRRHPQFNQAALAASLNEVRIAYRHFVALGGRRKQRIEGTPNTAWRVEAFNAYADFMQTDEFQSGLAELMAAAEQKRTAILCAEALPWRCHRRIIADALVAQGWTVQDTLSERQVRQHQVPEFARIADGRVTHPGDSLL